MRHCFRGIRVNVRSATWIIAAIFLSSALALAAKEFVKPAAKPARTYPVHDDHSNESVAIGVDPYDNAEKSQVFTVKWNEEGFLPIFVVVTNDGDQPISLTNMQAQLITSRREKLAAATNDDLYRRLSHISTGHTYPLPFPRTKVKGAVGKKALDEIDGAQFSAKAVEPHSTQSGFMFFDVTGISSPLSGGRFYMTGLRDSQGNDLLYFEMYFQK